MKLIPKIMIVMVLTITICALALAAATHVLNASQPDPATITTIPMPEWSPRR